MGLRSDAEHATSGGKQNIFGFLIQLFLTHVSVKRNEMQKDIKIDPLSLFLLKLGKDEECEVLEQHEDHQQSYAASHTRHDDHGQSVIHDPHWKRKRKLRVTLRTTAVQFPAARLR